MHIKTVGTWRFLSPNWPIIKIIPRFVVAFMAEVEWKIDGLKAIEILEVSCGRAEDDLKS